MRAIEIVSADGGTELLGEIVARLAERGPVGVVTDREGSDGGTAAGLEAARSAGAVAAYAVDAEGWDGAGEDLAVGDALDRLAPACEYGVVLGAGRTRLPSVSVGVEPAADDRVLASADSVAALDVDALMDAVEGIDEYETLESLVAEVKRSADEGYAGTIATFTGRVRAKDGPDDERTEYLEFERYDEPAKERMAAIRSDLEAREGVYEVRLHHETGVVEAGEDIVHVVVLSGHREEGFQAARDGIDRLKQEVPLFKKEVTESEEFWAHER